MPKGETKAIGKATKTSTASFNFKAHKQGRKSSREEGEYKEKEEEEDKLEDELNEEGLEDDLEDDREEELEEEDDDDDEEKENVTKTLIQMQEEKSDNVSSNVSSSSNNNDSNNNNNNPPSPTDKIVWIPFTNVHFKVKWLSLILLVVQNTLLVLLISYSRVRVLDSNQEGGRYLTSTAVVTSEALKIATATMILRFERGSWESVIQHLHEELLNADTFKLAVPGLLYLIQNNLLFQALSNLDAAVYQVTYQLKIMTTAFFSTTMLGQNLNIYQYISLVFLSAGVALVQLSKEKPKDSGSHVDEEGKNQLYGLICVLLACMSSGFAGVYLEKVMKRGRSVSIWVRNVQLGLFGVVFGIPGVYGSDFEKVRNGGFFQGYDSLVWTVVVTQAAGGLMIAVVIKFADNILKGFATSISIILSSIISIWLFNFHITILFVTGTAMVVGAVFLYGKKVPPKDQPKKVESDV